MEDGDDQSGKDGEARALTRKQCGMVQMRGLRLNFGWVQSVGRLRGGGPDAYKLPLCFVSFSSNSNVWMRPMFVARCWMTKEV